MFSGSGLLSIDSIEEERPRTLTYLLTYLVVTVFCFFSPLLLPFLAFPIKVVRARLAVVTPCIVYSMVSVYTPYTPLVYPPRPEPSQD